MDISGTTKIVGLFGYPVHHSLSPAMQNAAFKALGLDYVYIPLEVRPEDLEDAVRSLVSIGIVGVNVTIPHKEKVISFLDEISPEAELIGSVNTIHVKDRRLIGHNTDAFGFETAVRQGLGLEFRSRKIFVMGAGGVSRAVCFQAALSGADEIVIADIEAGRAENLCRSVARKFPSCRVETCPAEASAVQRGLAGKDLFVNATPIGMKPGDVPVIHTDWLYPGTAVFDLVYNPEETRLIREARERGLKAANGTVMLVYQGAKSFEIFTGRKPSVDIMLRALKEKLAGHQ